MIYPENTVLVPKVIGWINASLARAATQLQEPYISVKEVTNPLLDNPWGLPQNTYAIILPDAYIMVSFPPSSVEYQTPVDRSGMAQEAATQTTYSLASVTYKTRQDADDFSTNLLRFYQQLYTWNTDAIVVDKVHPEDVVRNLLFNQAAPTYATRAPTVGMIDPNLFLVGSRSYDVGALSTILTQYSALDVNHFLWKGVQVSFLYPSFGYAWDTSVEATVALGLSRGVSYSFCGYLVSVLSASQRSYFISQNWQVRIDILSSGAIYGNAYFSYLIRQVLNS